MKKDFTDYHCHLIPAVDDGSTDPQESLAMARILADFGFATVHCTPHRIKGCFDNEPAKVQQAVRYLQRSIHEAGIPLHLVPSTEHYLDEFLLDLLPGALTAGPSRYLLVEAPFRCGPEILTPMVAGFLKLGLAPLIAHPERCSVFEPGVRDEGILGAFSFFSGRQKKHDMPGSLVFSLRDSGCRFQANIGSFAGLYGTEIKQRAVLFLKEGLYSCIGTDSHRSERLENTLLGGLDTMVAAVGDEVAYRLLAGSDLKS